MNPLTMFSEKDSTYSASHFSMTRVVAFMFAATYCYVLIRNSVNAHAIGWPFCLLGVAALLAVPLQSLFKQLQSWVMTPPGKKVVEALLSKVATATEGAVVTAIGSASVRTTTEVGGVSSA